MCKNAKNCVNKLKRSVYLLRKTMFADLPDVLKDMIVQFAFKIGFVELECDLETLRVINSWSLHPNFMRDRLWTPDSWCFLENPLKNYFPLRRLRSQFEMFDMCAVHEILDRLDFRKRDVRCMGTRREWWISLTHFEFLGMFSMYFKQIVLNPDNFKPMWKGFPLMWICD